MDRYMRRQYFERICQLRDRYAQQAASTQAAKPARNEPPATAPVTTASAPAQTARTEPAPQATSQATAQAIAPPAASQPTPGNTCSAALAGFSLGAVGWMIGPLTTLERIAATAAGVALVIPDIQSQISGALVLLATGAFQVWKYRRSGSS